MQLSKRIQSLSLSPIRRLIPYSDDAKARGLKVYHLNIGQPDIKTPQEYFDAVRNFKVETVAYAASQGLNELRDAISAYYHSWDIPYDRDDIFITNGGSEALSFAVQAICDAGDELLVPEPFYANYATFARAALADVRPIPTKAEEGFHLPKREVIEGLINSRTRAIWISNPGNPTGAVYTREEIEMLADIAKKHDIFLIADEVYREFVYDGKFTSLAHIESVRDRVIMIDSVSKRYSACGARIGCIAIKNKEFMAQVLKLCQGRLCVSTLEQVGATGLYKTSKEYLMEVNKEYKARRDTLYNGLKSIEGVVCEEPKGAFYIMAKLPVDDSEKFIIWMLQNFSIDGATTMGAPGGGFYSNPADGVSEMRMAYVLKKEDLEKAVNIIKNAIAAYPGRIEAIKAR